MRFARALFFILLLLLPTQLGKHFWFPESLVLGRRIDYLSPTLYLSDLLVVGFCITMFFLRGRDLKKWILPLSISVAMCVVGWFVSPLLGYSMLRLFVWALFGCTVVSYAPSPQQILLPLGIGSCAVGMLAVAQFLQQSSIGGLLYWFGERLFFSLTPGIAQIEFQNKLLLRAYATFPHPNVLGGYLVTLLPWFLMFLLKSTKKDSWQFLLAHAAVSLSLMGIFLSFSRIAWAAALLVSAACFCLRRSQFSKNAARTTAVLFIVLSTLCAVWSMKSLTADRRSLTERVSLAQSALRMISTSPVLGMGPLQFIPKLPEFGSPPYLLQPVHSIYLLIASEWGLFGLCMFLLLCVLAYKKALQKKQIHLLISLSVVLFLGLFDHYFLTIQQTQLLLVIMLSLCFVKMPMSYNTNT